MNWLDVAILVLIALSAVISLMRGFVREALSLVAWVLAFWVALTFASRLAATPWLTGMIESPTARISAAFVGLFLLTLVVSAMINFLIAQLVNRTGLSGTDRLVGAVFGIARGVALVGVLVLLAGFTQMPRERWWEESVLLPQFEVLAVWMKDFLPADVQANLRF